MFKLSNLFKKKARELPPAPVPQKLREMLGGYPALVQRLQDALDGYIQQPDNVMPFDAAVWVLEAHLESFLSEARKEFDVAVAVGDQGAIKMTAEKERLLRHARSSNRGMSDLSEVWRFMERRKMTK